ncbi:uncharacterized protein PGTG_10575 [Puccinia graminis f. sp. tritici CRL 75-36-700-3]|uniref:Uncharacterized protein n=1 Tax=Puccinia graminis f. sp. tritici (strain CRL 75-36-700-3 / race SCCL) TaxID=418459 RepID=E3KIS2_PUCGT|nr:uncharacterized protein PGTG_10575 [Puccinia graminis f. sp. tritici CRL 75-36-700-3]EFP84197.2 hypothetical protein PGTG_10575 [Puccinia graminis f. sp. tritici CRL 75-36-700-3]
MLCSRTASLTKKKLRSKLFIRPFEALSSETKTAALLSHLSRNGGLNPRDFMIGMRNNKKLMRSDQGAALSLSSMENGRLATGQTGPERTDPGWNSALGPPARICLETGYDMRALRSTHYPLLPGRSCLS